MRITEKLVSFDYLTSINQAREKIVDLQSEIATGKRVLKPSDDPRAADAILRLNAALAANDQYTKNVSDGGGMADAAASALDSFSSVYTTLKETLVKASSTSAGDTLPVYAEQVDALLSDAVSIANTKFNGKYVFGGTQTLDPPYTLSADRATVTKNVNGINGVITYPVGDGVSQQVNIPGEEAFQGTGLIDLIIQVRDTLKAGSSPTPAQSDAVSQGLNDILQEAGKAGAIVESLDGLTSHLTEQKTQLTKFLSNEQDADIADSVMKLQQQQTQLQASLSSAAKILPMSLLDFLATT